MESPTPLSELVGRDAETLALARTLDQVASGRSAIALVEGEAGIGKTRLLETSVAEARRRGLRVVFARAEELERSRPFGLVGDLLGDGGSRTQDHAALASLLNEGRDPSRPITVTSDPGLQFRVVDAFTDLVEQLALDGPLGMVVDDLQWADPSSLLTLGVVGRRLSHLPVAIVSSLRPTPRPDDVLRLLNAWRSMGAELIALQPLSGAAVRQMVARLVAAEPGPRLLEEVDGAAGNPLFITELLGALLQDGSVTTTSDGLVEVTENETTLPPTLRLTMLHRLAFLPAETLQVLKAASILGSRFELTNLATVTGQSASRLSAALTGALDAHVLEEDGTHLRFRHDLLRESVYQDMPVTIRMALHREAGQRLADAGSPSVQVAEHLSRGAVVGDSEAIHWMMQAARDASSRSPDTAADLTGRALDLTDNDPVRRQVLAAHATNLRWAGRFADAEAACRILLRNQDDASVRMGLGHALMGLGRPREGLEELERAAAHASLTAADRANSLGLAAVAHLVLGDLDDAAAVANRAQSVATEAADHVAVSLAMSTLAGVSELRGRLAEAGRTIEEAVSLADHSPGLLGHRFPLYATWGRILMEQDRLDEARACLELGARRSEELGMHWHSQVLQMVLALRHFVAGEWDEAMAELDTRGNPSDEIGQAQRRAQAGTERSPEPFEAAVMALIELHRNDAGVAKRVISSGPTDLNELDSVYYSRWMIRSKALALETEGRTAEALDLLAQYWNRCTQLGYRMESRSIGPDLVRLAVRQGNLELGHAVAAATVALSEESDLASLRGVALHCRGLADSDPQLLQEAVQVLQDSPRPLERAAAAEDAGALLVREGSREQARPLLERAVEGYESLGAARDVARVEALMRGVGIRRGRRTLRRRPQSGWRSLTPTELTVADLVVEGMSNPQIGERLFISRRTVQTHLAHIFAKLDISSRSELAARTVQHRRGEAP